MALSICIPTYNFGQFIGETLQSIARQCTDSVEVLVVDGASTDNTAAVVAGFRSSIPNLRYSRLDTRGGIDVDMAISVQMAQGKYCWLFSADDVMEDGAITRVLEATNSLDDVYLCGLTLCSPEMAPMRRHKVLRLEADSTFDLSNSAERYSYFSLAETSTAFFSYMSSLVINRSRWMASEVPGEFMGSCWAHVARLFGMIPQGLKVRYLAHSFVRNRSGNDSFLDKGIVHRIGIAVNGFWRLADRYFGGSSFEARRIRRAVANEYTLRYLLWAKWKAKSWREREDERLLDALVATLLQDRTPRNTVVHLAYKWIPVRIVRGVYRLAKRVVGTR